MIKICNKCNNKNHVSHNENDGYDGLICFHCKQKVEYTKKPVLLAPGCKYKSSFEVFNHGEPINEI